MSPYHDEYTEHQHWHVNEHITIYKDCDQMEKNGYVYGGDDDYLCSWKITWFVYEYLCIPRCNSFALFSSTNI